MIRFGNLGIAVNWDFLLFRKFLDSLKIFIVHFVNMGHEQTDKISLINKKCRLLLLYVDSCVHCFKKSIHALRCIHLTSNIFWKLYHHNLTSTTPSRVLTAMNSPLDTPAARGDSTVRIALISTPKPMTSRGPYLSAAIPPRILVKM